MDGIADNFVVLGAFLLLLPEKKSRLLEPVITFANIEKRLNRKARWRNGKIKGRSRLNSANHHLVGSKKFEDLPCTHSSKISKMSVQRELQSITIIAVANRFNPSILSSHWFHKNGILTEAEIQSSSSIFTAELVQIQSGSFMLQVHDHQLDFRCVAKPLNLEAIGASLVPILERIGEVPYRAIGINFAFQLSKGDEGAEFPSGRHLFAKPDVAVFAHFEEENARFGAYMSKDYLGSRMRLEVKPILIAGAQESQPSEGLLCTFNFHLDLPTEDALAEMKLHLEKSGAFLDYALTIVDSIS